MGGMMGAVAGAGEQDQVMEEENAAFRWMRQTRVKEASFLNKRKQ